MPEEPSESIIFLVFLVTGLLGGMVMAFFSPGPKSIAGAILVVGILIYDRMPRR